MSEERHIVGFETQTSHTARWAKWRGLWGWVFGAFILVPGVGHVAIGGYLLYMLLTAGVGAAGGALAGGLTSVGIPKDGVPKHEADFAPTGCSSSPTARPARWTKPRSCSDRPRTKVSTTTWAARCWRPPDLVQAHRHDRPRQDDRVFDFVGWPL